MMLFSLPLALAAQIVGAAPRDAGDALRPLYLVPDQYHTAAAAPLRLRVESAAANAPRAWPTQELRWFFMRGLGTQENRDTIEPSQPGGDHAEAKLGGAGVTMLGIDFKPTVATVDRAAWKEYADKHGSEADRKA